MHRPTLWRQAPRLVLPAALVVLALAACGGGSQGVEEAEERRTRLRAEKRTPS